MSCRYFINDYKYIISPQNTVFPEKVIFYLHCVCVSLCEYVIFFHCLMERVDLHVLQYWRTHQIPKAALLRNIFLAFALQQTLCTD